MAKQFHLSRCSFCARSLGRCIESMHFRNGAIYWKLEEHPKVCAHTHTIHVSQCEQRTPWQLNDWTKVEISVDNNLRVICRHSDVDTWRDYCNQINHVNLSNTKSCQNHILTEKKHLALHLKAKNSISSR